MTKHKNFAFFIIFLLSVSQGYSQNKFSAELLMDLGRVSAPDLSPDGANIVYTVTYYKVKENKGYSDIYMQSVEGGSPVRITATDNRESSVKWHPDGKRVTYLSAGTKDNTDTQLWEMNADGSNAIQLTDMGGGISNYGFAASGNVLWFTADVKMENSVSEVHTDLPDVKARTIDGLMYRHWNAWHDYSYSHVFIADYKNGGVTNVRDIMKDEKFDSPLNPFGGESQIAINESGTMIAYTCKKLSGTDYAVSTNSDIYLYDVKTGSTRNLTEGMPGYDNDPVFTNEGRIIWHSMHDAGYESDRDRLMIANLDVNNKAIKEMLPNVNYSVGQTVIDAEKKMIYYVAGVEATYQIFRMPLNSTGKGVPEQITHEVANVNSVAIAGKSSKPTIISTMQSISSPTEIYKVDAKSGKLTAVSKVNDQLLSKVKVGKVEKRMVKTSDDQSMLTWVIYPPDFDPQKKYPTLLYCQGGPQSTVSQFFSYRWNFQLMAANGYIVVAPNRRGLPSFGEKWNDDITGDWGGQAMQDYFSAIDAVAAEPYADNERLGAVGASFGGYSVYWLAGNHNKRFKAFISHCGVFNLESMYGSTEEIFFVDHDLEGPYWKNPKPKSYEKFSPHNYVQNWDTPMLVIHNELDFRVPLAQGMEAFSAAQLIGVPSRFLYFPDEGHWVQKPQNSMLWQREFYGWLDKYLKP